MIPPADRPRPPTQRAAALSVVRRLRDAGHEALFAGGCVRDMLLHRPPGDYDVATDAHPDRIVELFRRTRKVGMKFGVVLVGVRPHWIEVATFRTDHDYADGRRPDRVQFTDAREDALRRDFTVNGMFYDPIARRVIDHVGGRDDLEAGVIRAIGDPDRRFAEDHLRMVRAVRFAARLGFEIDAATAAAIRSHAASIARISPERIQAELEMILTNRRRAAAFRQLVNLQLLSHLWPDAGRLSPNADRIESLLTGLPPSAGFELAMACVLHELPPRDAERACRALCCSNRTLRAVVWLVERRDALLHPDRLTTADLKLLMADPSFRDLLAMLSARLRAERRPMTVHRRIAARARRIPPHEIAPPPLLDGHDLARLGLPQGPRYKSILDAIYYAQLNGDVTDRAAARNMARDLIDRPQS